MKYYTDPALAGLWSRTMMPSNGPPPPAFFVQSLFFTFAAGVTLAAVFEFLRPVLGKPYWERVVNFTDIAVGLAIVFGFFPMILMFNVPIQLVASWFVTSWITVFLGTMVFAARTK